MTEAYRAILGHFGGNLPGIFIGSERFWAILSGSEQFRSTEVGLGVFACFGDWEKGEATVTIYHLPFALLTTLVARNHARPCQITYPNEIYQLPLPLPLCSGNYPKVVITTVLPVNGAHCSV